MEIERDSSKNPNVYLAASKSSCIPKHFLFIRSQGGLVLKETALFLRRKVKKKIISPDYSSNLELMEISCVD